MHEVAKDFGLPTKDIAEILTKFGHTPKNHMQALEDNELSLIFEHLTQHNQIASIVTIFAEGAKPEEKKEPPAKKEEKAAPATSGEKSAPAAREAAPAGDKKKDAPKTEQPQSRGFPGKARGGPGLLFPLRAQEWRVHVQSLRNCQPSDAGKGHPRYWGRGC